MGRAACDRVVEGQFLRQEHPDRRHAGVWVRMMKEKHPGLWSAGNYKGNEF
jgi:hypothetical protein